MAADVFTPKQIAKALGVSESSVKRWVDSGRLRAAKTVGGHRKVKLSVVADFVRETGQELVDPAVLGMVVTPRFSIDSAVDELFDILLKGDEPACRDLVLGFYQRGESIAGLGDKLIGPAFRRIGDGWVEGTVQVFEERRACEIMTAALHELRRWLSNPSDEAPLAIVATPEQDFASVPVRLVELALTAAGWRVSMAGTGLPLEEIAESVGHQRPKLLCLSVTHLEDGERFVARCNALLIRPYKADDADTEMHVVAGGGALCGGIADTLECDLLASDLAELVAYQAKLLPTG